MKKHMQKKKKKIGMEGHASAAVLLLLLIPPLLLLCGTAAAASEPAAAYAPSSVAAAAYPARAHAHWVWLASSQANRSSEMAFVRGFLDRDVPVGAVDLDSQWATGDNNF